MCGIAGYIGRSSVERSDINNTFLVMGNRGPDATGHESFAHNGVYVELLHSRLSIIDLDERANQPMSLNGVSLVFNGEIYNYRELKQELEAEGVIFRTESDTEILLYSYLLYGQDCVDKFEGMWSFAIYDSRKKTLFLSRDRFGEKPLFIYQTSNGYYFASEIKYIRALLSKPLEVNHRHLYRYLVNGYKSLYKTEETYFKGVEELPFASNMMIGHDLRATTTKYWQPLFAPKKMTMDEAIEGARHQLLESIKIRLRADVPLAFCLSGGVDSSAIVSIAAKCFNYDVATFSIIDRDERYNESENIRATIEDLGCKNTSIDLVSEDSFERLEKIVAYHDAPLATISYYIHSFLSEAISKQGYRVVCSGTAADELFTGYYDHHNLYLNEMRGSGLYEKSLNEWKNNTGKYVRNKHLKDPSLYFKNEAFREHIYFNNHEFSSYLKEGFIEPFIEEHYCESLLRNRMMNEMFNEIIPVILHEDDLNSMCYSVENRSPYLDSRLFEFCCSIPSEHMIHKGYAKYVLRESVSGILIDQVRLDRRKIGFNASIDSLYDFGNKQVKEYLLNDSEIFDIVDRNKVEELLNMNRPMPNSYSKLLFNIINTKIFLDQNNTCLKSN